MWKRALLAAAILMSVVAGTAPASAGHSEWQPFAQWEMNEGKHATILRDLSGNHFAGHIGKRVVTNGKYHSFPKEPRDKVFPQHVDRVPDPTNRLDPGYADFKVTVRFLWLRGNDMNLVQKGQGSPAGGMFKVKTSVPGAGQPPGHIKCLFRGSTGDSQVESYTHRRLDDGKWHTVSCTRSNIGTTMFVDGEFVDVNDNQPGNIDNDWPVAIGGNTSCEDTATENNQCNYWHGRIGFVRFAKP